jgi:hypothetical protein
MPSPDEMLASVGGSMKERTGRDLDEWVAVVDAGGVDPLDQKAVRAWLKDTHGVLQNTQWAIAFEVARRGGLGRARRLLAVSVGTARVECVIPTRCGTA